MTAILEAVSEITTVSAAVQPTGGSGARPSDAPLAALRRLVADTGLRGSVGYAIARLVEASEHVRDQMSLDTWMVLGRLERIVAGIPADEDELQPHLGQLLESLLAIAGIIAQSMVRDASWGFLDGGARVERAQQTASLLRRTLTRPRPPVADGQLTESVLYVTESIITHRRRSATGEGPAAPAQSAVSLLVFDRGNPRSIAYQLDRLVEDMALIGDEALASQAVDIREGLASLDLEEACAGDRSILARRMDSITSDLRAYSDAITAAHFGRPAPARQMPSSWFSTQEEG